MSLRKLPPGHSRLGESTGDLSSLNGAWFHTLDRCVVDTPMGEVIFPLMHNCFFGGAMHALLLLQNGQGDQLAADIAGFITKERQSWPPKPYYPPGTGRNDGAEGIRRRIKMDAYWQCSGKSYCGTRLTLLGTEMISSRTLTGRQFQTTERC